MMKIGIIGAMAEEVAILLAKMTDTQTTTVATRTFHEGQLFGKPVVVVQSGIGKVNAGIVAQSMITTFGATHVINTGIAGSLDNALDIGDIVISQDTAYHDVHVEEFGYPRGQVPGIETVAFPASEQLISLVPKRDHIKVGTIVTGDQFISNNAIKKDIQKDFRALCVEMEGAAIGQTCYLNEVPFLIVRSISDKADDHADETYKMNMELAVERSTEITEAILKNL